MEEMMEYEYQAHLQKQMPQPPPVVVVVLQPERRKAIRLSGDLRTVQMKFQENGALINLRNPIMTETPLHKAAAKNHVEILKFLLEWQGEHKSELEAKNMYGETSLHLAAKNGSTEAVKLLLKYNAFKEAKANNGMIPLHLAVWFSVQGSTVAPVEALQQANAEEPG